MKPLLSLVGLVMFCVPACVPHEPVPTSHNTPVAQTAAVAPPASHAVSPPAPQQREHGAGHATPGHATPEQAAPDHSQPPMTEEDEDEAHVAHDESHGEDMEDTEDVPEAPESAVAGGQLSPGQVITFSDAPGTSHAMAATSHPPLRRKARQRP